jgi:methylase of polypeptide subunit release factors
VRRLLATLPAALLPGGTALLEIGYDQGPAVEAAVAELPGKWDVPDPGRSVGKPRLAHVERT